jgi:ATP-dependent Lon protease
LIQGLSRVRIVSIPQEIPYRILEVEPIETIVEKSSIGLREEIVIQLKRNLHLGGEVTQEMFDFLNPLDDDVAFVDLAAYTLCKHTLRKQAMLEVQNLTKRASMLLDDLTRENDRLDLIKQALGGKQDEDMGFN